MRAIASYLCASIAVVVGYFLCLTEVYSVGVALLLVGVVLFILGVKVFGPIDNAEYEMEQKATNRKQEDEIIPRLISEGYLLMGHTASSAPKEHGGYLTTEVKVYKGTEVVERFTLISAARKCYGTFNVYYSGYFAVIVPDDGSKMTVLSSE